MSDGLEKQDGGVQVIEEKKVDIYDIAILQATNADVLVNWLNDNGFTTPEEAISTLQYYANQPHFFFIANKVNLGNEYAHLIFSEADKLCADAIHGYYKDEMRYMHQSNPEHLIQDIFAVQRSQTDEIKESCFDANANEESVKVLFELKSGVATPIKIEFTPEQPFYPMKMTSINKVDVLANVYLFSNTPMKDSSGLMEVEKMTTVGSGHQGVLNLTSQNYLTSFTYNGPTSQLMTDSSFETDYYDCSKDPKCETPDVILGKFVGGLAFGVLFIIMGWFVLIPAIAGFLLGLRYRGKPWKTRLIMFLALLGAVTLALVLLFAGMNNLHFLSEGLLVFGPMAALGYFPATTKYKECKVALAIVITLIFSYALLFTMFF